jgi:hypothetical protein
MFFFLPYSGLHSKQVCTAKSAMPDAAAIGSLVTDAIDNRRRTRIAAPQHKCARREPDSRANLQRIRTVQIQRALQRSDAAACC